MPFWLFCVMVTFASCVIYFIYLEMPLLAWFGGIMIFLTILMEYIPVLFINEEDWDYENKKIKSERRNNYKSFFLTLWNIK